MEIDAGTNELYIADGYGNKRVIVLDASTGAYKRHWGAYGKAPSDEKLPMYNASSPQFTNPVHCVRLSKDGLVYVCDRANNRVQVFKKDGTFVKQFVFEEASRSSGSAFDLVFSNAVLHWVDDHQQILRGAAAVLKPGGRLVVSCGGKGNAQDVFVALRPEMRMKRWREFFREMPTPYFFYAPGDYEKWLPKFGFKIQSLKLAPKDATYNGSSGFTAWLRTTWIPYVQRVPENLREEFIEAVTQRYISRHPLDAEGKVHVHMVRLEIEAQKF